MRYNTIFLSLFTTIGLFAYSGSLTNQAIANPQKHDHASTPLAKNTSNQKRVPLYKGLSNYNHPISTKNPQAQRYFNQGLLLSYGFNHAEAARAFQEAAKLDPNCAICHWGVALVLGPNINVGMEKDTVPPAWEALQKAISLSKYASPREQALIQALAKRYTPQPVEDRKSLNLAYANAMRKVAQTYPDDPDAATLFAEALMDTTPWDY
jgi:tetratricopeptide (TPR) repeat protein